MRRRKNERRSCNYKVMGPGETERRSGKDQRSGFWEKTSNDGNDRFWEYVDHIKTLGTDPADILEKWLSKFDPDFLIDDDLNFRFGKEGGAE